MTLAGNQIFIGETLLGRTLNSGILRRVQKERWTETRREQLGRGMEEELTSRGQSLICQKPTSLRAQAKLPILPMQETACSENRLYVARLLLGKDYLLAEGKHVVRADQTGISV